MDTLPKKVSFIPGDFTEAEAMHQRESELAGRAVDLVL